MGTLYVVATPIGNLEDLTLRARRILGEVSLLAAEDTRTTSRLLARHGIHTPMVSYGEHNEEAGLPGLLERLAAGRSVALVSEAGTPLVSDPGFRLVRAAIEAGHAVVPVPGPSAILAALSVSGLPTDRFLYLGFLPRRRSQRLEALREVARLPWTLVLLESPRRLRHTLEDLRGSLGDRPVAICRELTKLHEEVLRTSLSGASEHLRQVEPRGEITLVVAGAAGEQEGWSTEEIRRRLEALLGQGLSARDAVKAVAELAGEPRRRIYRIYLETRNGRTG